MYKRNLIIFIAIVLGCFVSFQVLRLYESGDNENFALGEIPTLEGPWNKVTGEYRVNLTLIGRLGHSPFPLIVDMKLGKPIAPRLEYRDALTLKLFDPGSGTTTGFYYLTSENFGLFWVPMCGNTEIGGIELYRLDEAKLIEVEGFAFDVIGVDDELYHLFSVNETRVLGRISEQQAVHIGKHFLDGKGYKTGRVLSSELEEKDPNYYWHILFKLERPDIKGPRFCWVIRFEQAQRPGHYFEVWIDASEYFVIGGGQCR